MRLTTTHVRALGLIDDGCPTPTAVGRQFRIGFKSAMKLLKLLERHALIEIDKVNGERSVMITRRGKALLRGEKL